MKNVTQSETDTFDEVNNVLNNIINEMRGIGLNQQLIEAKVETLDEAVIIEPKKKGKRSIRTDTVLLFILGIFSIASMASGYVTTDINFDIASNPNLLAQYLRDSFANVTSESFLFTPTATAPTAVKGLTYFSTVSGGLEVSLDGSTFSPIDTAGGVSLDSAYDFGSAGGGRSITVDSSAVTLTSTDAANNVVFAVDQADTAGAVAQTITSAGTGALLSFDSNGTGADILGSDSAWTITKAGKGTFNGGGEIDTADFLFDATSAGKDLEWDDSQFALHFLDNTILAIGGATTAAGDFTFAYDGTDFNLEAAAANDDYRMGETTHFNLVIHGETNTNEVTFDTDNSALVAIWDGFKIRMNDNDLLLFGDSSEFTIDYDEASTDNLIIVALNANDAVQVGDGTTGTDFKAMAATSGDFLLFDASADELFFEDVDLKINEGAQIEFSVADNSIDWTIDVSTDETLLFLPAETTDDQTFNVGDATNTSDVRFFGATASTVVFDASADEVLFNDYDISMGDGDIIRLGDGDDITIAATGTTTTITLAAASVLTIADTDNAASLLTLGTTGTNGLDVLFQGATAGDIVDWDAGADTWNFGVDATGVDVFFYGDTTLKFMKWVEATNLLSLDGATDMLEFRGASVDAHETTLSVVEPTASNIVTLPDDTGLLSYIAEAGTANLSGAGTIPLTDAVVLWTSTGADAITLPDGTSAGQILSIVLVAQSGGAGTLTPTSVTGSGWATMVFTNIGESATFLYVDSTIGWLCLGTFGVSTQPLITQ